MKPSRAYKSAKLAMLFAWLALLPQYTVVASTAEVDASVTTAIADVGNHTERSVIPPSGVVAVGHDFVIKSYATGETVGSGHHTVLLYQQLPSTIDDPHQTVAHVDRPINDPRIDAGNEELSATASVTTFQTPGLSVATDSTSAVGTPVTEVDATAVAVDGPANAVNGTVLTAAEEGVFASLRVGIVANWVGSNSGKSKGLIVGSMPGTVLFRAVETAGALNPIVIYANADRLPCGVLSIPGSQTTLGGQLILRCGLGDAVRTTCPSPVTTPTASTTNVAPTVSITYSTVFVTHPSTATPTTAGAGLDTRVTRAASSLRRGAYGHGLKTFQIGDFVRQSELASANADVGDHEMVGSGMR